MGREGCAAQSHDAAGLYLREYGGPVGRYVGNEGVAKVYAFGPFVALDCYLYMSHIVAADVFARSYALHRAADRRMYPGGYEAARFGYGLAGLHLVADGHYGLRRRAKMLGHGYIYCLRQRQDLDLAVAAYLVVIRMDAAYAECLFHIVTSSFFGSTFFGLKFTATMAPVGHSKTHCPQALHLL